MKINLHFNFVIKFMMVLAGICIAFESVNQIFTYSSRIDDFGLFELFSLSALSAIFVGSLIFTYIAAFLNSKIAE